MMLSFFSGFVGTGQSCEIEINAEKLQQRDPAQVQWSKDVNLLATLTILEEKKTALFQAQNKKGGL